MNFAPVPVREHAIVWEIRPGEARGALFEFGMEQRLILRRAWRAVRGAPLPAFLKLKRFRKVPVVVSLHPALAHTFILPFRLSRKKGEAPLAPENLQVMLREFLAKTTFEMRRLASETLGVEELDAILLDARLAHLLADGEEVRDDRPVEGRRIEGFLHVTLTTRAVFHDLHDLLHSGRELFFTERGPAALAFLSRHLQGPLTLLDLEGDSGHLFHMDVDAEEVLKKQEFPWSASGLPAAIVAAWEVSARTAKDIYAMYAAGKLSSHTARFMRKLLGPTEDAFERTLAKAKPSGTLYVRSVVSLPFALPATRASVPLADLPLAPFLERAGLTFKSFAEAETEEEDISFFLFPFLEFYYHRGDPRGHRFLTRHIHWISA